MSNKIKIYLIYADDCKDCKNIKFLIERVIRDCGKDVVLEEVNCETEEAISLSLDNGINDLPGCIIGKYSFCGKNSIAYCTVIDAIEATWKEQQDITNYQQ